MGVMKSRNLENGGKMNDDKFLEWARIYLSRKPAGDFLNCMHEWDDDYDSTCRKCNIYAHETEITHAAFDGWNACKEAYGIGKEKGDE